MAVSNLKKRIFTGTILIPAVLLFIWLDHILLPIFTLIFVTFAGSEYLKFCHRKEIYPHTVVMLIPVYVFTMLIYFDIHLLLPGFAVFLFVSLMTIIRFPGTQQKQHFLAEVAVSLFGIMYLTILPAAIILLRKISFQVCLTPLILTWIYDSFAFFVGSAIGRHHLAPRLSPKKTWEGTALALPLTFPFTYFLIRLWFPDFNMFDIILITVFISVLATLGDLFESGMKRDVGLKDASAAFPGHGGFLDRIDSLVFTVPFFYLYVSAIK
ncbi:MAG: phosphatidate cytidylyltransferase [candidate division WOR-3 bacterium]|nr:MAG: phosphatidate cytidylyltransferase [candidate division WOR-3 bacterium]